MWRVGVHRRKDVEISMTGHPDRLPSEADSEHGRVPFVNMTTCLTRQWDGRDTSGPSVQGKTGEYALRASPRK